MPDQPSLSKNESENRYEIHLDGTRIGFIDYLRHGDVIEMPHTEVDPEHGGQGYAQRLADFALNDVRDSGLLVKPTCPFVARHIARNPAYGTLLSSR